MESLPGYDEWKLSGPPEPKGRCGCGEEWADHRTCRRCGYDMCQGDTSAWQSERKICGRCTHEDEYLDALDVAMEAVQELRIVRRCIMDGRPVDVSRIDQVLLKCAEERIGLR